MIIRFKKAKTSADRKRICSPSLKRKETEPEARTDEVQIIRKNVKTKQDFEQLKADLESQGFRVYGKEYLSEGSAEDGYFAVLLAEKRIPADPGRKSPLLEDHRNPAGTKEKILGLGARTFWWVVILLAALIYFVVVAPMVRAIIEIFRK